MAPITRKRKAEIEATREEEERKRLCLNDPIRSPSPPPSPIIRKRHPLLQKKYAAPEKQYPKPVVFFTMPEENPASQVVAKSQSSNEVETILATKALVDHTQKYGGVAMPTQQALEDWLESNKSEFVKAQQQSRARRSGAPSPRRVQNSPRATHADGINTVVAHPAERPGQQQRGANPAAVPTGGIVREVARHTRRAVRYVIRAFKDAADLLETQFNLAAADAAEAPQPWDVVVAEAPEDVPAPIDLPALKQKGEMVEVAAHIRPIAPVLDERFFHPDGRLQGVYKYLTAQIPLPRRWVEWAVRNGVTEVEGRGDIRDPGTYVAEDTFDYGALYELVHRGEFRTGRREIDWFPETWPMVRDKRDGFVADLRLHRFPPREPKPEAESASAPTAASASVPEPVVPATMLVTESSAGPSSLPQVEAAPASAPAAAPKTPSAPAPMLKRPSTPAPVLKRPAMQAPVLKIPASVLEKPAPVPKTPSRPAASAARATSGTFGLPANFYDVKKTTQAPVPKTPSRPAASAAPATSGTFGLPANFYDVKKTTQAPVPKTPSRPAASAARATSGTFGLPANFYDDSSSSSSSSEDEEDDDPQEQERQKQLAHDYLQRSRAALREGIRAAGVQKHVPSPNN
ncbi:hypothetical protein F4779DRAFT_636303 [Xylariaceae sp. FL0662B]|nr:hypothetical protein F4779DRAFT_636303 [Xylariaceae sp. FL0662B]